MGVERMKPACLVLCLAVFSGAIHAEQSESCAGLGGSALTQCRSNQQTLRLQERLEQQLQLQQERQNQLDRQQQEVQQQLDSMRVQNESLRKQLEREAANQPARTVATASTDSSRNQEAARSEAVRSWKADNPWFGTDYVRTQFAMRYVKQLQQDHPDLAGRELLDVLSAKVNQTFPARP